MLDWNLLNFILMAFFLFWFCNLVELLQLILFKGTEKRCQLHAIVAIIYVLRAVTMNLSVIKCFYPSNTAKRPMHCKQSSKSVCNWIIFNLCLIETEVLNLQSCQIRKLWHWFVELFRKIKHHKNEFFSKNSKSI